MKCRLILLALLSAAFVHAEQQTVTLIIPHSPSFDLAKAMAGWEHLAYLPPCGQNYGIIEVVPELTKSFRPQRIAQCLFGDGVLNCKHSISISGSQTERTRNDWLADYFGLPTDFKSLLFVRPHVTNGLVNFQAYYACEEWCPGLYARIQMPLIHTRWDLNLCEEILESGTQSHAPGYFNATGIARDELLSNFIAFASGEAAVQAGGITIQPLRNSRMDLCSLKKTGIAECTFILGYNFWQNECYHFGLLLRGALSGSNKPKGIYLFEPILGNGGHHEFGGGFTSHLTFWECPYSKESAGIYLDFAITHLFPVTDRRSFDLKGSTNSRYMLAARFDSPITGRLRGDVNGTLIAPNAQFKNEYAPVANLTTFKVQSTIQAQAELALMIVYTHCDKSWLFGYSFWGRSCEFLCKKERIALDGQEQWVLKGDAAVYGFEDTAGFPPVALSASQSQATIFGGLNFGRRGATTAQEVSDGMQNPNIDNPREAFADVNQDNTFDQLLTAPAGIDQINTSIQPIFIRTCDIDMNSARTFGMAHKIFAQFTYQCQNHFSCVPYFAFGSEVEFGRSPGVTPVNQHESCINCALSFWSVWFKGGVAFD